jgi:hypothetical protein
MFALLVTANKKVPSEPRQRAADVATRAERRQRLWQTLLYFVLIAATIATSTIIARLVHPLP